MGRKATREAKTIQEAIKRAISERESNYRKKVNLAMKDYRANHKRLGEKALAARLAGLSYGYYVALVLEKRGRLTFKGAACGK